MRIDGRCFCGDIAFEAEADPGDAAICHCTDCQVLTSAAFRMVVMVRGESFKLLRGQPTVFVKTGSSGAQRAQGFCPRCGTPIYSAGVGEGPVPWAVRLGAVRQRADFTPKVQMWCRSAQPWLASLDAIRRVETQ